jgi:hypothetical protein
MDRRTRIDPTLTITPRTLLTATDQLKDQLTSLAQGRHTVNRFLDLAKDRFELALDEIRPEDAGELRVWLNSRAQAGTGKAKIKWDLIEVFLTQYATRAIPTYAHPSNAPFLLLFLTFRFAVALSDSLSPDARRKQALRRLHSKNY